MRSVVTIEKLAGFANLRVRQSKGGAASQAVSWPPGMHIACLETWAALWGVNLYPVQCPDLGRRYAPQRTCNQALHGQRSRFEPASCLTVEGFNSIRPLIHRQRSRHLVRPLFSYGVWANCK